MKNHLVFCCNYNCLVYWRDYIIATAGHFPKFERRGEDIIFADDRYLFFTNINDHLERLMGITARDYRVCDRYALSGKTRDMLAAMRRET